MSAPKLCKDCRWYEYDTDRIVWPERCRRPTGATSLVDGSEFVFDLRAEDQRFDSQDPNDGRCGQAARYFEPRPTSLLRRILAALGLATLPGCAAAADAILVAAIPVAILAALWVLAGLIVASWRYEP